jgi:[ribosomal protein S18]-alanine N-acetyltransferase
VRDVRMGRLADVLVRQMTQADAEEIAGWHYEPPYSFYDATADAGDLQLLLDDESRRDRYFSAFDRDGVLVGFFEFKPQGSEVELGLGLRPDLTGGGLGLGFVTAGMGFGRERFRPSGFRLSVATFNGRAIRVYERAGFRPVRMYFHATNGGIHRFLEMACEA